MPEKLPGDPNLPPGVTDRDIDPPVECPECGREIRMGTFCYECDRYADND